MQLLVPSEVEVDWDEAFNGADDDIAALVPVDVMVYDGLSGEPVVGEEVVIRTNASGVRLLHVDTVRTADVDQDDTVWDVWRDRYVSLDEGADPALALAARTDSTGLARVYVMVDEFRGIDDWSPASVTVQTATLEEPLLLVPR